MSMPPPPPPPPHHHHSTAVSQTSDHDRMMMMTELTEQQRPSTFTSHVAPPTMKMTALHDPSPPAIYNSTSTSTSTSTTAGSTNAKNNNNNSSGLTITNTPIATTNHHHYPHNLDTTTAAATTTTTTTTTTNTAVSSSFWTNVHQSLDEAVNEFLMTRGGDTDDTTDDGAKLLHPQGHPHHHQKPLPQNDLERLPFLVQQRSYVDALLTTRLLLEGSSSHYTTLFDALKNLYPRNSSSNNNHHHHTTNNSTNNNAIEMALDTHKRDLVTIMTIHITCLMKLQLYTELTAELESWTFCFHHRATSPPNESVSVSSLHDTTTLSSWIPWEFHILAASTLPDRHYSSNTFSGGDGDGTPPLDRCDALYRIRHAIIMSRSKDTHDTTTTTTTLLLKVESTLHNVYLNRNDYRMALQCIDRMIELIPMVVTEDLSQLQLLDRNNNDDGDDKEPERLRRVLSATYQSEYWSRQGRILLQLGVLDGADVIFDQTKDLVQRQTRDDGTNAPATTTTVVILLRRVMKAQVASNDGLMKFSRGKFEEALESFHTVVQELRSIKHNHSSVTPAPLRLLEAIRSNLYCETTNNMALCALYTCRLHEGIQLLESLIRDDVRTHFNERVTLNLCTMYELAMDTSAAMRKKKILQCLATRFVIQDIPVECFRIG